jgi:hypothetical protein
MSRPYRAIHRSTSTRGCEYTTLTCPTGSVAMSGKSGLRLVRMFLVVRYPQFIDFPRIHLLFKTDLSFSWEER